MYYYLVDVDVVVCFFGLCVLLFDIFGFVSEVLMVNVFCYFYNEGFVVLFSDDILLGIMLSIVVELVWLFGSDFCWCMIMFDELK